MQYQYVIQGTDPRGREVETVVMADSLAEAVKASKALDLKRVVFTLIPEGEDFPALGIARLVGRGRRGGDFLPV